MWKKPVKNRQWRRVHGDFLRLLKGIQQLMRWIASCNNNLVWALKVYYPCIHDYTCCQEQVALDLLSTKTVELEEWYKAFTQQKSKLYTYISSFLILLISTNFCPGEANFLAAEAWKFSFSQGVLLLDPTRAYAAPGPRYFQRIFLNAISIPVYVNISFRALLLRQTT